MKKHTHVQLNQFFLFSGIWKKSFQYYRKRGSASYIVREWLLWVVERERDLWRHRYHAEIASDQAYDYLDGT